MKIKSITVIGGQGQSVTLPLKGHEKRTKSKFIKKYTGKAKGVIADPEDAWEKLEKAHRENKGKTPVVESSKEVKAEGENK